MDAASWERLEQLFAAAIELDAKQRAAFCDRLSGADAALASELRSLLAAHDDTANPLDRPALLGAIGAPASHGLRRGQRVGAWSLGELIGRGGAGEVYFAQRVDGGFEQTSALKLLYRDADADVQRFHAERQILARLEHPGIARLLDGGSTDDGRLYVVVEHVDGEPLTEHCRQRHADLATRLALFVQVCEAVAYAHRNLIVHRDLKPGNILVTPDGRVKLLDFGVAKQLDRHPAHDATVTNAPFTSDYAAPEQLTGQPITTATDVYALGLLLFELLTGQRPWRSDGWPIARLLQAIVHEEPAPASQVAASNPAAPVPARRLAGDLDAIIATCLRKNAADRYAGVDALLRDLAHHAANEPVNARGQARLYRIGRALQRYRWAALAASLVVVSLALGLAAAAWQAHRAEVERDTARRAATREEALRYHLINLFRTSIAQQRGDAPVTAKEMLDRSTQRLLRGYRDDPERAGKVVVTLADLYGALGDVEGQAPLLEGFLKAAGPEADAESVALAQQKLANLELLRGHAARAAELLAPAETFWRSDPARFREQRLESMMVRGALQRQQGDLEASAATFRAAIDERTALSGAAHRETANLYNSLAITLTGANRLDEALAAYRAALAVHAQLGQADDLDALVMLGNTGTLAFRAGRLREAEQTLKTAFEKQRARAGDTPAVAAAMGLYGATLTALGRTDEALATLRPAVAMAEKLTGPASPVTIQDRLFLTDAMNLAGDRAGARALAEQNLALAGERFGAGSVLTLRVRLGLARMALEAGDAARAHEALQELVEPLRKTGASGQPHLAHALHGLGDALLVQDRPADAVAPLREALGLRERLLWAQSWELALTRARLGEALLRSRAGGADDLLASAAVTLAEQLGPEHPQVVRVQRVLAARQ